MKQIKIENIEISSPEKIIFKLDKVTKLDVIKYYQKVAKKMLTYLSERPISVVRCHSGTNKECIFRKHPTTELELQNSFVTNGERYFFVKNQSQLIHQAQLGTIEFHMWGCKSKSNNKCDVMIFDLDPDENIDNKKLIEGVKILKKLLDKLKLKSFLKTSGGKGYHIFVPLKNGESWQKVSDYSKSIALLLEEKYPQIFTTNIRKDMRTGKIFVDYLRNKKGATCVAPFSLRSKNSPTLSMPIGWRQLENIKPNHFTIFNFNAQKSNSWKNYFKIEQKL